MRLRDFRGTPGLLLFGLLPGCVGGSGSIPLSRPADYTQASRSPADEQARLDAAGGAARLAVVPEQEQSDRSPYAPAGPGVTAFVRRAPAPLAMPDADSLADEGAVRISRGDLPGAERSLRAAVALDPNNRRAAVLLGQTLTQQARVDDPARPLGWEQSTAAGRTGPAGPALPPPAELADAGTAPPNKLPAGFDLSPPRPAAPMGGITPVGYTQETTGDGPPMPPPPVLAAKPDADSRSLSPLPPPAGPEAPRGPMARLQPPQEESEQSAPPAAPVPPPPVVTVSAPVVESDEKATAAPKRGAVLLPPTPEPEPSPEVGPPAPPASGAPLAPPAAPKPTAVIPAPPSAIIATSATSSQGPVFVTPATAAPALLPPEVTQPGPVVQTGPVQPKPILLERVDSDSLRPVPLDKPAEVPPMPQPVPTPKPPVQVNITDVKAE
jgi:hypothetical protein